MSGTILGVPILWGSILGSPYFGKLPYFSAWKGLQKHFGKFIAKNPAQNRLGPALEAPSFLWAEGSGKGLVRVS